MIVMSLFIVNENTLKTRKRRHEFVEVGLEIMFKEYFWLRRHCGFRFSFEEDVFWVHKLHKDQQATRRNNKNNQTVKNQKNQPKEKRKSSQTSNY